MRRNVLCAAIPPFTDEKAFRSPHGDDFLLVCQLLLSLFVFGCIIDDLCSEANHSQCDMEGSHTCVI